jgi:thiol-disulfide isomerase/thioredoxin
MMGQRTTTLAGVLAVVALALVPFATPAVGGADLVTGIVVDAEGHPVQAARVGTSLTLAQSPSQTKVQIGYDASTVLTDARGTFAIPAAPIGYSRVLVAAGPDGSLGFAAKAFPSPTRIRLRRAAKLKVSIFKPFGHSGAFAFDLLSADSALAYASLSGTRAEFAVPQGSYVLRLSDPESAPASVPLQLTSAHPKSARVELHPTVWAQSLGKPAPSFTPTDLQNWPAGRPLSALKGKWVLVSFWATWCRPCVQEMPDLIRYYEHHPHDHFEIVAVHSEEGGASFAAILPAYDRLVKGPWGGERIPFPLLFDSTGHTQKVLWGINVYPTMLLIDPDGKLLGLATLDDLRRKVGE